MGVSNRRRAQSLAMVVLAMVSVTALLAYAVFSDGYPVRKVDLNDSGIWVTSNSDATFGRFNKSASFLDAYFNPPGGAQGGYDLDVLQDQGSVVARDVGGGAAYPVDVVTGRSLKDAGTDLPSTTVVKMAGGTIAALDPLTGKVWALRYDPGAQVPALSPLASTAAPLASVGAAPKGEPEAAFFSALAVGVDGGVHVVTRAGRLVTIPVSGGAFAKPVTTTVASELGVVDISAIGPTAVVLDATAGTVYVGAQSTTVQVEDDSARLQTPVTAGGIAVAASNGLYAVDATGSAVQTLTRVADALPAAPVEASGCLWAAWAGTPGTVVRSCNGAAAAPVGIPDLGTLSRPVFRVNRGVAVLNDVTDGGIVDLELNKKIDPWQDVRPPDQKAQDQAPQKQQVEDKKNKPKAADDDLAARPGVTTILHVLDNDTDPSGRPLAVSAVTAPGNPQATAIISPDGQSIRYTLGRGGGDSEFQYDLSNGIATARGTVKVAVATDNKPPYERTLKSADFSVANGGTIPIPVIDAWRDPEGDPVTIAGVTTPATGSAIATPDGHIEFTATGWEAGGPARIEYSVTDGRGGRRNADLDVTVQPVKARTTLPAVAKPDVARGEVNRNIDLAPLANDVQGVDPHNPKARLILADDVPGQPGLTIVTDKTTGRIVARADKAKTYFLDYTVAYGSAPIATGTIRIDALKPGAADKKPVTMPDHAAIHGQAPVLVDVLANDVDPAGGMLTVTSAAAEDGDQVRVAVLKGRWLRVMPTTASFEPNQQVIHYTVTNGSGLEDSGEATGDLVVTQLDALSTDAPVTRPDEATVRDGDSVLVPVLDNDATPGGRPLTLGGVQTGATVGTLKVTDLSATDPTAGDLGTAYVVGDKVRYVAPQRVQSTRTLQIDYTAWSGDDSGGGTVEVTVNPQPGPDYENLAPSAKPLEARVVAGETFIIDVEASGNDPDGDSTAVVGIATPPRLGRVIRTSPTGIIYEAYPSMSGPDDFTYTIADRYGKQSTSLVRVAVIPPSVPQAAVAVPDAITAAPGTTVTVAPLSNDFYSRTDPVRVQTLDENLPAGTLDGGAKILSLKTPSDGVTKVSYAISGNGGESEPSEVLVTSLDGFQNPPKVFDVVAKADSGTTTATADVLASAYDPDGDTSALKVSKVHVEGTLPITQGRVTVPTKAWAQAVPFEVEDESGATSAAVMYVPAAVTPGPFVRPNAVIRVDTGQKADIRLSDVVADGQGKPVALTTDDASSASPEPQVSIKVTGEVSFTVTGAKGYVGPGAVTVEVSNGILGDPAAVTKVLTIPVQIGPETPVLRCPSGALTVTAGGNPLTVDLMSLCAVWTPSTEMAESLTFAAEWDESLLGVEATVSPGRSLTIVPGGEAEPGAAGTLEVSVPGTKAAPSSLKVQVVAARRPSLAPITLTEMKQGEPRTVDITGYLHSSLRDKQPTVVSVVQTGGQKASAKRDGSKIVITPGASAHGPMTFRVVASDVAIQTRTDRQVSGTISFQVYGVPDTPARPQPGSSTLSKSAVLSWPAPAANGARILTYAVKWAGGQQDCPSSPCTITNLTNGESYSFSVAAKNKAGESKWSEPSAPYKPNTAPRAVPNFRQTKANDGSVTLTWGAAVVDGSPVERYVVVVDGKEHDFRTSLSGTVDGLVNGPTYTFTIYAENEYRAGPSSRAKGSAAGNPILGGPVTFGPVAAADADSTAVRILWPAGDQNGPSPIDYTVTRTPGGESVCSNVADTSCIDGDVTFGSTYTYSVVAWTTFLGEIRQSLPRSASITPIGLPGKVADLSVKPGDGTVQVSFTTPNPRGPSCVAHIKATGPNGSSGGWSGACVKGQAVSRVVDGMRNGDAVTVEVWISNGTRDGASSTASPAPAPWGQLDDPGVTVSVNGSVVTGTVSTPTGGNGGSAQIRVVIDGALAKTCNVSALRDASSCTASRDVGWGPKSVPVQGSIVDTSSLGRQTVAATKSGNVGAQPSVPVSPYNNYGSANQGIPMCLGNPNRPESMPGGTATQTFSVPSGVSYLSSAMVQIDPNSSARATLQLRVNGSVRATASATPAGDTRFTFGQVNVSRGDQVSFSVSFSSTVGKIITVYTAGSPGGTFTASNSCSDGAPNVNTTSTGLRAVVSGMS